MIDQSARLEDLKLRQFKDAFESAKECLSLIEDNNFAYILAIDSLLAAARAVYSGKPFLVDELGKVFIKAFTDSDSPSREEDRQLSDAVRLVTVPNLSGGWGGSLEAQLRCETNNMFLLQLYGEAGAQVIVELTKPASRSSESVDKPEFRSATVSFAWFFLVVEAFMNLICSRRESTSSCCDSFSGLFNAPASQKREVSFRVGRVPT